MSHQQHRQQGLARTQHQSQVKTNWFKRHPPPCATSTYSLGEATRTFILGSLWLGSLWLGSSLLELVVLRRERVP